MRKEERDGYYNIDFECEFGLDTLRDILVELLPQYNILLDSDEDRIEYFGNKTCKKFEVCLDVGYMKENGVFNLEDIKTRTCLYLPNEFNILPLDIMRTLQNLAQKINSKIYICMEDLEKTTSAFGFSGSCKYWCIDKNGVKVVFNLEDAQDHPTTAYYDYIFFA